MSSRKIHSTAIVYPECDLGSNVEIGPFTIIYPNVSIGDNAIIGSNCEIGYPATSIADKKRLVIGPSALVRSHSIFYEGSEFGPGLRTGHRVTVRECTKAGRDFQVGTLSDIQGHCEIGDFVRFHSNVHIGQRSVIKNCVWIFPYVVLTNDPHPPSSVIMGITVEDYAAIATMSVILPGVTIGEGALVGAHSSVANNVHPNTVVAGSPAKFLCETSRIKLRDGSGLYAYPWRKHFHRGYPQELVQTWLNEFKS